MVTDLAGTIYIQSEKNLGTKVNVSIPVETSTDIPETQALESSSMISDVGTRSRNVTLCLIGFDHYPDIGETPTGILGSEQRRMLAIKSSINSLAKDWFTMNIIGAPSLDTADGDILIALRSQLDYSGGKLNVFLSLSKAQISTIHFNIDDMPMHLLRIALLFFDPILRHFNYSANYLGQNS